MKEHDLKKLLQDKQIIEQKIKKYQNQKILTTTQNKNLQEIQGHLEKSEHNQRFTATIKNTEFKDWAISGCYYACYHAALALILQKKYFSKNHLATLCVLIKEYYKKELDKEDIELLSQLLDYEDLKTYVETKNKREQATYSTKTKYEKEDLETIRVKTALFVSKAKTIIERNDHF